MDIGRQQEAYLCLCNLIVMVRELEVGPSCVDVHPWTKNIAMATLTCTNNFLKADLHTEYYQCRTAV